MDKLINEDQKVPEITERTNYDSRGPTYIKLKLKNNSKVWFKVFNKKKGKEHFFLDTHLKILNKVSLFSVVEKV